MSDINVNFTINQFNAELLVDPAPEVTLNVQDPMTAQFYIEGTTGGPAAPVAGIQYNGGNGFLAASSNFTYQANANIGWPSLTGNIVSVGNIVVGEVYSGYEAITIKSPSTGNPTTLFIDGSIRPNKSGGSIQIKAGDAYGTGPIDGSAGSLYLYCGVNDLGSGQAGEVWIGGSGTPANVRFIGTGSGFQFTRYGEFFVGGGPGEIGHVLTSQGQFTSPLWLPLGNVSQINLNGNSVQVLAGDGTWIPRGLTTAVTNVTSTTVSAATANTTALGFNLTTSTIGTIRNLQLFVPDQGSLRTNLNIGNVANLNLNGNASQFLTGAGTFAAGNAGTVTSVNTSGSSLGFSLTGGPITSTGTITLNIPTVADLRTSLNIGNIANINLNANGSQVLAGNGTWIAQSNLNNVTNAYEAVTLHTTTSGTYNYDILTSSVSYSTTAATANITINFRGNSTTTLASQVSAGKSVTAVYLMTTTATGYVPSTIQIDGTTATVKYAANVQPIAIPNTVCSYTYTMIKTSDSPAVWTVLGSQTRYG